MARLNVNDKVRVDWGRYCIQKGDPEFSGMGVGVIIQINHEKAKVQWPRAVSTINVRYLEKDKS